jgi:pectate lyase
MLNTRFAPSSLSSARGKGGNVRWLMLVTAVALGCGSESVSGSGVDSGSRGGSPAGASGGGTNGSGGGSTGSAGASGNAGRSGSGGTAGSSGGSGVGGRGNGGISGTGGTAGVTGTGGSAGTGGSSAANQPIGWASFDALGQNGTTGGSGGPTTTVSTCATLKAAVSQSGAAIVNVSGTITCDNIVVSSNKSIIGLSGATLVATPGTTNHLLVVQGVSNVIVQNLVMQGAGVTAGNKSGGDTFHVESNVHHLWADHLDVSDGDDGNFDITLDCNYITVSWTKFHYTSATRVHRFSNLIAAALGDTGTYKITFHHDWWATNVDQRSPRAHEGSGGIHLFNNYYSEVGNSYCVGVGQNAIFLSENNYFDGVNVPFYMTPNGETGGQILSKGDLFHNTTGNTTGTNTGFTPPYPYTLDPAASVPALVQAGAGATLK